MKQKSKLTADERLIMERCAEFLTVCTIGSLLDDAPRHVLTCIAKVVAAHDNGNTVQPEHVKPIASALIGFAQGKGYLAHLKANAADYLASVIALAHMVAESDFALTEIKMRRNDNEEYHQ